VSGFKKFILRGNLVDLAVAFVIATAFTAVVMALVKDFITPLIAAIGGEPDFSKLAFTVNHSTFLYGDFINSALAFVILAAVVYFLVVAPVARFLTLTQRKQDATVRACPECLSEIPLQATRCMYCTAVVPPVAPAAPTA